MKKLSATKKLVSSVALCLGLAVALAIPVIADANTVAISGSMEGSIKIANGDWVSGGYAFSVQGSHPAMTVYMENASITFSGPCSNGGSGTLTVPLSAGPYSIPANDNSVYPSGDEQSDQSFQGAVQANVCGGTGTLDASRGATFSADLQSDDTVNTLNVQFHYRDPNAKGKGNYDCMASNYAADVCGASWSGTAHLTPSATSSTTSTTSSTTTTSTCTAGSSSGSCCSSGSSSGSCCTSGSSSSTCTTTSSTSSTTATTTSSVLAVKTKRHKCAKGKRRNKKGVCVAKKHAKKISRKPKTLAGFTG
jgi:hypothetical protein